MPTLIKFKHYVVQKQVASHYHKAIWAYLENMSHRRRNKPGFVLAKYQAHHFETFRSAMEAAAKWGGEVRGIQ